MALGRYESETVWQNGLRLRGQDVERTSKIDATRSATLSDFMNNKRLSGAICTCHHQYPWSVT